MNTGHQRYLLLKAAFALLITSLNTFCLSNSAHVSPQNTHAWLNIFVHGIISIKPHITVSNFMRFITDTVADSPYSETVSHIRNNDFFYQNQAIQGQGLKPINLQGGPGAAASLMANVFEKINGITAPIKEDQHYYTYGWSGLLSRRARYNDARDLFKAIEQEVKKFKTQGINPKIRIMGYSHGGTIAMKLALIKRLEYGGPQFSIDELFLFGTPIQYDTDYLINDPLFKRVYNIFSRGDRVQKLDFFSCGQFFSEHIFENHGTFCLPDKLTQIEIRVIRKKGEDCNLPKLGNRCPLLYDGKRCSRSMRNVSPGHTELWFFGWTPLNYRKSFPLYPLPIVAYTPFILHSIKPYEKTFTPEKPVILTLDPYRNSVILNNNQLCATKFYKLPFIGVENFLQLRELALSYAPDAHKYHKCAFDEYIDRAFQEAYKSLRIKKHNQKNCL